MTRLSALSHLFLPRINSVLFPRNPELGLKKRLSGYVLILFIAALPVLLFGTKWVLDQRTAHDVESSVVQSSTVSSVSNTYKRCAKEVALAVAKNWNPGLTLGQQKDGIYKVADAVYNAAPAYSSTATKYEAIPGMDVPTQTAVTKAGQFNPIKVTYSSSKSLSPDAKTVGYTKLNRYLFSRYAYTSQNSGRWNQYYGMWLGIDKGSDSENRRSMFDELKISDKTKKTESASSFLGTEIASGKNKDYVLNQHELYFQPYVIYDSISSGYPSDTCFSNSDSAWSYIRYGLLSSSASNSSGTSYFGYYNFFQSLYEKEGKYYANNNTYINTTSNGTISTSTYTKRSTGSDANYVKISIVSDSTNGGKIQVETDSDVSGHNDIKYAIPAQCNVDIVLAVPVNGAASNANNRDSASDTAESPLSYTNQTSWPSSVESTPIYQMGQACKNFVKDNFYHVRGVTMGLIPYSGKLSISPDRATAWTVSFPQFVDTSTDTQLMIGSCLYGTQGQKGQPLKRSTITTTIKTNVSITAPYYWGGLQHGCPIMFRRGTAISSYGGNSYYGGYNGYLLNSTDPSTGDDYKYLRMNLNPCTVGYANQLSMKCEKACTYFSANPYYVIEPTADLVKIYEMCNALMPFYDPNNVSNFIFLPFEWANNFWQSWTNVNNPSASVSTGSGDSAVLKREAKTSGRKKALILLVNKPDWFEPGEMTYLGFDNDFSEVPVVESDKIDFSINYSDTSKKYLDGTAYDGTPRGLKKIIRYATQSGTIARNSSTGNFECADSGTGRLYFPHKGTVRLKVKNRDYGTGLFSGSENLDWKYYSQALNPSGYTSYNSWASVTGGIDYGSPMAYGGGNFTVIAGGSGDRATAYSTDGGITWSRGTVLGSGPFWCGCVWAQDRFIGLGRDGYFAHSFNGKDWIMDERPINHSDNRLHNDILLDTSRSRLYTMNSNGYVHVTNDLSGISGWSCLGQQSSINYDKQMAYGGGYYVQHYGGQIMYSSDGLSWSDAYRLPYTIGAMNIIYANGHFVVLHSNGHMSYTTDPTSSSNWKSVEDTNSNSSLYTKSGKTGWKGLCYGSGNWVACTTSGDVAILEDGISDPGTIQFTNINYDSTEYKIIDEKTFTITPDQIYATNEDEYYIDFNVSNLRLISAEITNATISDICKPVNVTYTDADYGEVNITNTSTSTTSTVTETIDFAAGYDSCHVGKFMVDNTRAIGDAKMNQTSGKQGYELNAADAGEIPCRIEADAPCDVELTVEPVVTNNLKNWKKATMPGSVHPNRPLSNISCSSYQWRDCCYGAGKFVAIQYKGYVAISADGGNTWTAANGSQGARPLYSYVYSGDGWYSCCYNKNTNLFIAIHNKGYVATSPDGITWTRVTCSNSSYPNQPLAAVSGSASGWNACCYGDNKCIAVNSSGYVVTSEDGINWEKVTAAADTSYPDQPLKNIYSGGSWERCVYSENRQMFLVLNYFGDSAISGNGTSWSAGGKTFSTGYGSWHELYCIGNNFVARSYFINEDIAQSTNGGSSWSRVTPANPLSKIDGSWYGNCYSEDYGIYLAVSSCGYIAKSTDGLNWTQITMPDSSHDSHCLLSIATCSQEYYRCWVSICFDSNNNKFVAISNEGKVAVSDDGIIWTHAGSSRSSCPLYDAAGCRGWISCCYNKNRRRFFAMNGIGGRIVSSEDGITWSLIGSLANKYSSTSESYSDWSSISCSDELLIATNFYGGVFTSPNGSTWSSGISAKTSRLYGSCYDYDNNRFMVMGDDGGLSYSEDGSTWTRVVATGAVLPNYPVECPYKGINVNWNGIDYGAGIFFALDQFNARVVTANADDIATWTGLLYPMYSATSAYYGWVDITYGKGRFVAINRSGAVAYLDVSGQPTFKLYTKTDSTTTAEDGTTVGKNDATSQALNVGATGVGVDSTQKITGTQTITISRDKFIQNGDSLAHDYHLLFSCTNLRIKKATLTYTMTANDGNAKIFTKNTYRLKFSRSGTTAVLRLKGQTSGLENWVSRGDCLSSIVYASHGSYGHCGNPMLYANGKFLSRSWFKKEGGTGQTGVPIGHSANGETWSLSGTSACSGSTGSTFANGFLSYFSFNYSWLSYSKDGNSWSNGTSPGGRFVNGVTFGNGKLLTTNSSYAVLMTEIESNGSHSWVNQNANLSSILTAEYDKLAFGNGKFIVCSPQNAVAYSYDGKNWINAGAVLCALNGSYDTVTYGNGKFLYLRDDGAIATSVNGTSWSWVGGSSFVKPLYNVTNLSSGWDGICYGKGRWVAVNAGGYVATCDEPIVSTDTDASSWYQVGSGSRGLVSGEQTIAVSLDSTDSDGNYYADITLNNVEIKANALRYSRTHAVDDIIDFHNNNTTSRNSSYPALTYSGASGSSIGGGLYSRTGAGTINLLKRGKLKLKIMPSLATKTGTFKFTTGSDTTSKTVTGTFYVTVDVKDQAVSGNQWYVSFDMTDIVLVKAEFIWEPDPLAVALPNENKSAYVDFSQTSSSKPYHSNNDFFTFGSDINGTVLSDTTYDSTLKRWCTTSGVNKFYDQILKYKGLIWLITEDLADSAAVKNLYYSANASSSSSSQLSTYMPGLVRTTYTADQVWNYLGFETTSSKKTALTAAGITLPINTALYAKYGQVDSNEGLKKLMKDACSKLKTDHGTDDVRVYIVKFREQTTHAERTRSDEGMTRSSVDNDYSYFDDCTSYVYSATESNLKDKLNTIADDIKSWVGYQNAKNVE